LNLTRPKTPFGPDCSKIGSNKTKSHPNSDGTSFNPKPTELKFKLFKNSKGFVIMGKGGKDPNLLPLTNVGKTTAETSRAEVAGGDPM